MTDTPTTPLPAASLPWTLAVCVGAVLLVEVLGRIAVPGFDLELIADIGMRPMGLARGVIWVVAARGLLALTGLPGGALWMLIPFAGVSVGALQEMEGFLFGGQPVVLEPGMAFRILGTLTMLAGASVIWAACDAVSATGRISGPALLGAWAALPDLAALGTGLGVEVAFGLRTPAALLGVGLLLLPPVVLGSVTAIRGVPVGPFWMHLRFRSPWDAPLVGLVLAWIAGSAANAPFLDGLPPVWLPGLVATTLAGLMAREMAQHDPRGAPVPLLHLVGPALSALVVAGALLGFIARQGIPVPQPSPWSGAAAFTVVLSSPSGSATADGPRLVARLEALGVDAEWTAVDPHHLELAITDAKGPEIVPAVLPPGQLEILDRQGGRLTNTHVADASVGWTERGPYVSVVLTPDGSRGFCAMSTARVGDPIDIVLDGVVHSSPVVREPICGGRVSIDMGGAVDPVAEANALASTLSSGTPLQGTWAVDSIR